LYSLGRGGILGAEEGTKMIIEGGKEEVQKVSQVILSIKDAQVSGIPESLHERAPPNEQCRLHRYCIYKMVGGKGKSS
jgi:6-phosphogluconate dehydrogenase (decarboxylating)